MSHSPGSGRRARRRPPGVTARRPLVAGCAALLVLAAACGGARPPSSATQAQTEPSAAPPGPGRCPLTDLSPPAGVSLTRPVLAVKVDDAVPYADPQAGLESADIVYQEPVEGGLSWFLALYHCSDPLKVGPVRNVDPVDPDVLVQYGSSLLASAGGSPAILPGLQATPGLVTVDSAAVPAAYSRDSTRKAPYNLFVDPMAVRTSHPVTIAGALAPPTSQFRFADHRPASGQKKAATLTFQLGPKVSYRYDPASNGYLRSENGQPQMGESGSQIRVTNVMIIWTQIGQTQTRDAGGNTTPIPAVVGQGNAMVLTGGLEYDGKWSRADRSSGTTVLDGSGKPIALNPGTTWIHLLPADTPAYVS